MNNKHIIKVFCTFALLVSMAFVAQAQVDRAGYFLKGYHYGYRLNPSFQPKRGFLSLPVLGNTSVNMATNFELSDFLYPRNNGLVTFMHPDVSADEFVNNLSKNNKFNFNLDITPLSLGFYAFGGFNTIDIGIHSSMGANIPRDMFRVMKDMGAERYVLDDLGVRTRNYAEIAIGHSHKINNDLTIGARLKLLAGLAYAEIGMDKMEVVANDHLFQINAQGRVAASVLGTSFTYNDNGVIEGFGSFTPELSNLGFGIDLGATYDFSNVLTKGLILSASLNDINFIRWNNTETTGFSPAKPYTFNGFSDLTFDTNDNAVNGQFEEIGEDLSEFFAVNEMAPVNYTDFWGATLNVGLEYKMPFYDKLSVGALFTQRFEDAYSYSIGSLMLNLSPVNFFDLAANVSASTFGFNYGAMLNINFPGFSIFAAADMYMGKVSEIRGGNFGLPNGSPSVYIPLNKFNASGMLGINIPFGKVR